MKKNLLLILGPPGSGKSTQAKIIENEFKFKQIIQSNLLKEEVKKKTKVGLQINKIMLEGNLVPYEITCKLLYEKLKKTKSKNILIDGFPRQMEQVHVLDYFIYTENINFLGIIYINLTEKECIKRLVLRKREDDTPKAIRTRLYNYFKETKPVIERYDKKNKLIKINGNKTIENVAAEIKIKLKKVGL
jgi:adenylate kinase